MEDFNFQTIRFQNFQNFKLCNFLAVNSSKQQLKHATVHGLLHARNLLFFFASEQKIIKSLNRDWSQNIS